MVPGAILSMGYGFVEYKTKKSALNAIKKLQVFEILREATFTLYQIAFRRGAKKHLSDTECTTFRSSAKQHLSVAVIPMKIAFLKGTR